ncbi:Nin-like protein [Agrobacterium vitis]|uniref:Nin-like protein n=1 Tax=Agrobacterium vitis TaxID=373 RepID=UPI001573E21C|nr:Nin-like protein [Agrobacterium vitis]NSY21910.1 Nin-like protein [Agrobacterium vitis]WEO73200.1 Nin-like protein [Agrobacterium vitis]
MHDPFLIQGPAMISFSGGRISAYMLYRIVQAHGGKLPDDIVVAFANTGKEREETLHFVYECGSRWGVSIRWLEWRDTDPCYELVGFNSASRNGEPFAALIRKKQRLPNWQERWCTSFLKLLPMFALAKSFAWVAGEYAEVIGIRDDEGMRILNGLARAERDGRKVIYPLAKAKIRKADVMDFWRGQPFDLGLEPWEGNCDLCMATGRGVRLARIRRNPGCAKWWHEMEVERGGFFDRRDRVIELVQAAARQVDMFEDASFDEFDAECGDGCGFGEAAE